MRRRVIPIITSIAVRSGMISTYRTKVFENPGKQQASTKTTGLCSLVACHEVILLVELKYGMNNFAVPPLPSHLVAGRHGILHALDWLLRRWPSQSAAHGISNSEARKENVLFWHFVLVKMRMYLWRLSFFVLRFYPLYVGSCEGMNKGVIPDRIMGHHNTPLEV